jgi:hypothetical protein
VNFTQHQMFQGALKSGVASVTGVILANVVDMQNPILSLAWLKHIGIASFFVLLVTEARYLNQWANSGTEAPVVQAIGQAKQAAQKTEVAIDAAAKVVGDVPKP